MCVCVEIVCGCYEGGDTCRRSEAAVDVKISRKREGTVRGGGTLQSKSRVRDVGA